MIEFTVVGVFAVIVVFAGMIFLLLRQQHTIERLTDKLMAKDYGEYKRHEKTVMREESRQRKPQSFYDDATVETDEVQ